MQNAGQTLARLTPLTVLALLLAACQLIYPAELSVTPSLLEFSAGLSTTTLTIENTGKEQSVMSWAVGGSQRLTFSPTAGTLQGGASATVIVAVDRTGLVTTELALVRVQAGRQTVEINAVIDPYATPGPAPCPADPTARYASVTPIPLDRSAAAFALAGIVPTGVIVRWDTSAQPMGNGYGASPSSLLPDELTTLVSATHDLGGATLFATPSPITFANRMAQQPGVLWIELDGPVIRPLVTPAADPNDPWYVNGSQWWLNAFGFAESRLAPSAVTADDVVIAVIDTGTRSSHEDLVSSIVPGISLVGFAIGVAPSSNVADGDGHGSHVAGLAVAQEGNGVGIVGIASHGRVRVQPIKVFDDDGSATISDLVAALRWASGLTIRAPDNTTYSNPIPVDVINMSLGAEGQFGFSSPELRSAVIDARCENVVLLAASGNGSGGVGMEGGVDFPAAYPEVLSIGSVDENRVRSAFSDFGEGLVDLMAPGGRSEGGTGLLSALGYADDAYGYLQGTSMATPLAAGSAALLIASDPVQYRGNPAAVEMAMRMAAAKSPGTSSAQYGAGVLCLDALLTTTSVCGEPVAP
jgi:subtilisin family serine protease